MRRGRERVDGQRSRVEGGFKCDTQMLVIQEPNSEPEWRTEFSSRIAGVGIHGSIVGFSHLISLYLYLNLTYLLSFNFLSQI